MNLQNEDSILLDDDTIEHSNEYTYLGARISDNPINKQVQNHMTSKQAQFRKFYSFLNRNPDSPYGVKKKIWTSALNSSVFYGCETWIAANLNKLNPKYNSSIKHMISVRNTTCNEIVHIETGLSDAKSHILDRQTRFIKKLHHLHNNDYISRLLDKAI